MTTEQHDKLLIMTEEEIDEKVGKIVDLYMRLYHKADIYSEMPYRYDYDNNGITKYIDNKRYKPGSFNFDDYKEDIGVIIYKTNNDDPSIINIIYWTFPTLWLLSKDYKDIIERQYKLEKSIKKEHILDTSIRSKLSTEELAYLNKVKNTRRK